MPRTLDKFFSACLVTLTLCFMVTFLAIASIVTAPMGYTASFNITGASKIALSNAWARATPAGAHVAAAYLTLENKGEKADILLSVSSPVAKRTELHQTTQDVNGALSMHALPAGITLDPSQKITLAPGGTHVMLMQLTQPLAEGFEFPLTLTFQHAGEQVIRIKIQGVSYMPGMKNHDGHAGQ